MRYILVVALALGLLTGGCGGKTQLPTITVEPDEPARGPTGGAPPTPRAAAVTGDAIPPATWTPSASAMPLPTPELPFIETHIVQPGDTLGGISLAYDVPIAELLSLNGLGSESAIISVGQALLVPLTPTRTIPSTHWFPDSEVVYSPAYLDFDVGAFIQQQAGYLAGYGDTVNGEWLSATEIIQDVARQYSVGPRVLLAVLEVYGGWVTQTEPFSYQASGPANPYYEQGFYLQLSWVANRINQGYYGYKQKGIIAVAFQDGGRALIPEGSNAGTAGVQSFLALNGDWDTWEDEGQQFLQTYHLLFGDPFALAVEPLIPSNLAQPPLALPWERGEVFYYTGGPHAAYGSHSTWAALDFAPPDIQGSCYYSAKNITAATDGTLYLADTGEMYLDLDGDGDLRTGWVLLYLHVVANEDVIHSQRVTAGTPLGYASCEGGISNSSHLHLARRYNGEWIAADGPVPFVLSGWQAQASTAQYDGMLVRNGVIKTACECWDDVLNALAGE